MARWRVGLATALALAGLAQSRAWGDEASGEKTDGAASEAATPVGPNSWTGYLWRDPEGRVRLGWPVVAMGVMTQPPYIVPEPLARKLAPLLSSFKSDWCFLNYALEEDAPAAGGLPHALVTLRGRETSQGEPGKTAPFHDKSIPIVLEGARLVQVEFIADAWWKAWGVLYRTPNSPFRVRIEQDPDPRKTLQSLAPRALEALRVMRAQPSASAHQRTEVAAIDANAKIVDRFRQEKAYELTRWLRSVDAEHGLALPGLDALGVLPPTQLDVQRLFLVHETRVAFLAAVRAVWPGDLAFATLPYYESQGPGQVNWAATSVEHVEEAWTEAEYASYRELTQRTLGS